MRKEQIDLLMKRLVFEPQKHRGIEPEQVKKKYDLRFCLAFFGKETVDIDLVHSLLEKGIHNQNEAELDLLLMLLEHFAITHHFDLILAKLLIQPWHHLHDRIANILEFDKNEETIAYLYQGALYRCDHLDYESDYCEFNRKCLYALAKIGTTSAIDYIKKVSISNNSIISYHAKSILVEFDLM